MTVFSTQEFSDWNGGTGFYRPSAVQDAIQLGENKAVEWLNTGLAPTSFEDELPWPGDWQMGNTYGNNYKLVLSKVRLISIDTVTSLWSDSSCAWVTETGTPQQCAMILNARQSIIRIGSPRCSMCGNGNRFPERLKVEYTAGFPAADIASGTPIGTQLRAIVFNAALGFLQIGIGLNADGNVFKTGYQAAGYSESRQLPQERSGSEEIINEFVQLAFSLARGLKVKRQPRMQ